MAFKRSAVRSRLSPPNQDNPNLTPVGGGVRIYLLSGTDGIRKRRRYRDDTAAVLYLVFLLGLPLGKLPLAFFAFKVGLNVGEQAPGEGLQCVFWYAGAINIFRVRYFEPSGIAAKVSWRLILLCKWALRHPEFEIHNRFSAVRPAGRH